MARNLRLPYVNLNLSIGDLRMAKKLFVSLIILGLILASPSFSYAQDSQPVECDSTCPEGQTLVSFADGNTPTCVCVAQGEGMDETVPTGEFAEGEEIEQVS